MEDRHEYRSQNRRGLIQESGHDSIGNFWIRRGIFGIRGFGQAGGGGDQGRGERTVAGKSYAQSGGGLWGDAERHRAAESWHRRLYGEGYSLFKKV